MEVQKIRWDLFQKNGQIGYYVLGCQINEEDGERTGGAKSKGTGDCTAQQGL